MKDELRLISHGEGGRIVSIEAKGRSDYYDVFNFERKYLSPSDLELLQSAVEANNLDTIDDFYWFSYRKVDC